MDSYSACLVGATGLVGRALLQQLVASPACRSIVVLGRRTTGVTDAKLTEHLVDFDQPAAWADRVRGDVLFSALGTTVKQAGGQAGQYKVDYTYQMTAARAAVQNGVGTYALISSLGATPTSPFFYARMKGELERDVLTLGFEHTVIVRPGLLAGERDQKRTGEDLAYAVLRHLPSWRALDAMRPYPADVVARATIGAATSDATGPEIVRAGEIFRRA
jgi:uncharacterized protein YbjT (DUF2867 family)